MTTSGRPRLEPLPSVPAGVQEVAYYQAGPADGDPVLLHGFPYDIHSYEGVIPRLVDAGLRVVVSYLRGHGPTRFMNPSTPRSGQQAALGADVIDLLDALHPPEAILAGYDRGGRAACVAAALWPDCCAGLVCVNGYLNPELPTDTSTRQPWTHAAQAFDPDHVEVVLHAYRHRLGFAPKPPSPRAGRAAACALPAITVPAVTLDGLADGNFPSADGTSSAHHFTGPRVHHQVPNAGHNLAQEAPAAFADAILEVAALRWENAHQVRKD